MRLWASLATILAFFMVSDVRADGRDEDAVPFITVDSMSVDSSAVNPDAASRNRFAFSLSRTVALDLKEMGDDDESDDRSDDDHHEDEDNVKAPALFDVLEVMTTTGATIARLAQIHPMQLPAEPLLYVCHAGHSVRVPATDLAVHRAHGDSEGRCDSRSGVGGHKKSKSHKHDLPALLSDWFPQWRPVGVPDGRYRARLGSLAGEIKARGADFADLAVPLVAALIDFGPHPHRNHDDKLGKIELKYEFEEDDGPKAKVRVRFEGNKAANEEFASRYSGLIKEIQDELYRRAAPGRWAFDIQAFAAWATVATNLEVDREPPVLNIVAPSPDLATNATEIFVSADWVDSLSGIDLSSVGATIADFDVGPFLVATTAGIIGLAPVPLEGRQELAVVVSDNAGNQTTASVSFVADYTSPIISFVRPRDRSFWPTASSEVVIANNDGLSGVAGVTLGYPSDPGRTADHFKSPVSPVIHLVAAPFPDGEHQLVAEAVDFAGNRGGAAVRVTVDTLPPRIDIAPLPDKTDADALEISGVVQDLHLASFHINGAAVVLGPSGAFAVGVTLDIGPNVFLMEARDRAGHRAATTVTIARIRKGPQPVRFDPHEAVALVDEFSGTSLQAFWKPKFGPDAAGTSIQNGSLSLVARSSATEATRVGIATAAPVAMTDRVIEIEAEFTVLPESQGRSSLALVLDTEREVFPTTAAVFARFEQDRDDPANAVSVVLAGQYRVTNVTLPLATLGATSPVTAVMRYERDTRLLSLFVPGWDVSLHLPYIFIREPAQLSVVAEAEHTLAGDGVGAFSIGRISAPALRVPPVSYVADYGSFEYAGVTYDTFPRAPFPVNTYAADLFDFVDPIMIGTDGVPVPADGETNLHVVLISEGAAHYPIITPLSPSLIRLVLSSNLIDAIWEDFFIANGYGRDYTINGDDPPDTILLARPAALLPTTAAVLIDFAADEVADYFECRVDNGPWTVCAPPLELSGLDADAHNVQVRAYDLDGNVDPTPAVTSFELVRLPETRIDVAPPTPSGSGQAQFVFSSDIDATFECRLDQGDYDVGCGFPDPSLRRGFASFDGLGDGSHRFSVRARSPRGLADPTPATYEWVVNRTLSPPAVTGLVPADGAMVAVSQPVLTGFHVPGAMPVTGGVFVVMRPSGGHAPLYIAGDAVDTTAGYSRAALPVSLADGFYMAAYQAIDAAGLRSTFFGGSFFVDAQPPIVGIEGLSDGQMVAGSSTEFEIVVEDASLLHVTVNGTVLQPADAADYNPALARWTFRYQMPIIGGANDIVVTATDGVGRQGRAHLQVYGTGQSGPAIRIYGVENDAIITTPEGIPREITATFDDPDGIDRDSLRVWVDLHPEVRARQPVTTPDPLIALGPLPVTSIADLDPVGMVAFQLVASMLTLPFDYVDLMGAFASLFLATSGVEFDVRPSLAALEAYLVDQMFIDERTLKVPGSWSGEGFYRFCIEIADYKGFASQECRQWKADLFAPEITLVPLDGATVVAGPAAEVRVEVRDKSATNYLLGNNIGPVTDPTLPREQWSARLNGQPISHLLAEVGPQTYASSNLPLGPDNEIEVSATDYFRTVQVRHSFRVVQDPADIFVPAVAGRATGEYVQLASDVVSFLPFARGYPQLFKSLPYSALRGFVDLLVQHRRVEIIPVLIRTIEAIPLTAETDYYYLLGALEGLATLAGYAPSERLDQLLWDYYSAGPASVQLAIAQGNAQRPAANRISFSPPNPKPHTFVQYFYSGIGSAEEAATEVSTSSSASGVADPASLALAAGITGSAVEKHKLSDAVDGLARVPGLLADVLTADGEGSVVYGTQRKDEFLSGLAESGARWRQHIYDRQKKVEQLP